MPKFATYRHIRGGFYIAEEGYKLPNADQYVRVSTFNGEFTDEEFCNDALKPNGLSTKGHVYYTTQQDEKGMPLKVKVI